MLYSHAFYAWLEEKKKNSKRWVEKGIPKSVKIEKIGQIQLGILQKVDHPLFFFERQMVNPFFSMFVCF